MCLWSSDCSIHGGKFSDGTEKGLAGACFVKTYNRHNGSRHSLAVTAKRGMPSGKMVPGY